MHRHLLEHEVAVFTHHNFSVHFEDPILTLPDLGRVIVRADDFQAIYTVPEDRIIVLPFEILSFKSTISVTYLHTSGQTVQGLIHVSGKTICQRRHCYIYIFQYLKCYSPTVSYVLYIHFCLLLFFLFYGALNPFCMFFRFIFTLFMDCFALFNY